MRGCKRASDSPRQLQALVVLLSITATFGLKQTVQLYRKSASLDSNPQRRLTNVLYYGTMQLGTPGQEITVCPDTGSAAIWTSADATPPAASGNINIGPAYNGFVSNASSSFQLVSYSFAEKYNSGGVVGVLASDRVQLGGLVVGNASLGLVTEASVDLMGASCAGVLGLGRPGLAVRPGTSVFYRMLAEQGLLDMPSFSLWLDPNPAAEPAGSLTFGGVEAGRYTGALTNITVISSKYWMVPLLGVEAAGVSLPVTARGAILDSSSAFSLVTDRDFLIFQSLPGVSYSRQTGAFQVIGGCGNITALPNLTLTLGGRNFTLTPQNYVVQVSGAACALGFQPGAPDNTIVLGTGFLRAYFTAYTYNATSRSSYVSFAPAAPGNSTTARRRAQELGGYPGGDGSDPAGNTPPPQAVSASSAAVSADALGGAADQDALLAATLAAQAAASAPTPAPAPAASTAPTPRDSAASAALSAAAGIGAGASLVAAAPLAAPAAAPASSAPTSPPMLAPEAASPEAPVPASPPPAATLAVASPQASSSPALAAPAPAPEVATAAALAPAPFLAPATEGITTTNAELFPELVPAAPVQPSAPALAPAPASLTAPTEVTAVMGAPAVAPAPAAQAPAFFLAPATEGITTTNAELFPELVPAAPVQPSAPALAPAPASLTAPTEVTALTGAPAVAPAPQALASAAASSPAAAAAGPLPAGSPIPAYLLAAPAAPTPGPVAAQPGQAPAEAPSPAPASAQEAAAAAPAPTAAPSTAPVAAPDLQPTGVETAAPAPAPVPAGPEASYGSPAPADSGAVAPISLAAPTPAPAPSAVPADIGIPVTPLTAAAPAAVASSAAPGPSPDGPSPEYAPMLPPAPAPVPLQQPADISIPVTPLSTAPVSAPAPAPAAALAGAMAVAAAPAPAANGPVSSFSLPTPALAVAPAPVPAPAPMAEGASGAPQPAAIIIPVTSLTPAPLSAPTVAPTTAPAASASEAAAPAPAPAAAPAGAMAAAAATPAPAATGPVSAFSLPTPALAVAPAPVPAPARMAEAASGAPQPAAIIIPVTSLMPAPLSAPTVAPTTAPAASTSEAAAPAPAPAPSTGPSLAPAANEAVGAAAAPAVMPPSMAPFLAPAPSPLAAAPMSERGPFGTLFPAGAGNASDVQPPFQAIPGLEVLYGGLGSLWRLPLQLSTLNDTLLTSYLAAHPLTARQNRTLAKPRPPTLPGFGQPINLVKLTGYRDTCVVGWSSVNSCISKGLNGTTCALMPFFDDVDSVPYQCPFKNETQVQVPAGSGNYVPISQQWLLVRPGARGQQIYNVGLGKCLDICTDRAAASLCGHAGNVYLQDCDATSPTQQWLLNSSALANATVSSANTADLAVYQITSAYVPPVATQVFGAVPLNQTCIGTCEAERDAQIMPNAYGETTCNNLLPTYPSSAAVFPCNAQRLPHSISQGFAIVFAPQPQSA